MPEKKVLGFPWRALLQALMEAIIVWLRRLFDEKKDT